MSSWLMQKWVVLVIQRQEDTVVAGQSYSIGQHMTEVNVLSDEVRLS